MRIPKHNKFKGYRRSRKTHGISEEDLAKMEQKPIHTCHAVGCLVPVEPKLLMCRRHWYMVPKYLQSEVWDRYRPGQEVDKDPSREYLSVARRAIEAVRQKETGEYAYFWFGEYKEKPFSEIPTSYLRWFVNTALPEVRASLLAIVEQELWSREDRDD